MPQPIVFCKAIMTLGLPLEYQKHPEYFDAFNVSEETDAKNAVIEQLLKAEGVKTVLDMTCGTGSQVFYLLERGYQVTGSDFSPALLTMARERARQDKQDVSFIDGDMRNLQVGQFDAVITIFNAIGHLTKSGFEKALRNIHQNLKDGGIYIFDILNLEAMTDAAVADLAWCVHKKVNGSQIHNIQFSTLDREKGRLTSYDHYVIQKAVEKPTSFRSRFTLQIYTAGELQEMLIRNGFETVGRFGMDGSVFIPTVTSSIVMVVRKVG